MTGPTPTRARTRTTAGALLALLAALLVAATSASASPGALDTTWSADGVTAFDSTAATSTDEVTDLAPGPGATTWVLSRMLQSNGLPGASLARLTSAGALDTSFSADGLAAVQVGTGSYSPAAVLPRAGGGAIVVGTQNDPSSVPMPALVAFTAAGALDTAWGSNGIQTWPAAATSGFVVADAELIGSDIVVAGWNVADAFSDDDLRIVTSALSGAWGSGTRGPTTLEIDQIDHVTDIAAGQGGTLLVAGSSSTGTGERAWAARLLTNGSPDATWSSDGIAFLDLDAPGAIVAAGSGAAVAGRVTVTAGAGSTDRAAVEQLTGAGAADGAFGDTGVATFVVPGAAMAAASSLQRRPDSGYFVSGTALPTSGMSSGDPADSWWGVLDSTGADTGARLADLSGDRQSDGVTTTLDGAAAGMLIGGHDDQGASAGRDSLVARVQDFPPPTSTLAPAITGASDVGSALTCVNGTWTGSPTSYTYAWYADGILIAGATAAAHTIVETVGTVLTCRVTATNAGGSATATSNGLQVTTPATGPANTTRPIVTGATVDGATLSCSAGTWADVPDAYGYQWTANGTALPGENASSWIITGQPVGTQVRCVVTAYSGTGSTSVASNPVTISLPDVASATVEPTITGNPEQGLPVTCDPGTWTGTPTFDFAWTANGAVIPFETSQTYQLSVPAGTQVRCRVTATNAGGSSTSTSAPVTVTPLQPPVNTMLPAITGMTDVGSTLTCWEGTWSSSAAFSFQWTANGAPIAGANSPSYDIVETPGTLVGCTVTATNAAGTGAASADPITVTAVAAPTSTAKPVISGSTVEQQTVTCDTGAWDGSAIDSFTYQWYADGVAMGFAWDNWLNLVKPVGTVITCEVTATNAGGSATVMSDPITITAMQAPINIDVPAITGGPEQYSDLTCGDGNWDYWPTSYAYQWKANGTPIPGATAALYNATNAPGTSLTCTVTATNYVGTAAATSVPLVVVALLAPANTVLPSAFGSTDVGDDLTCNDGSWDNNPTGFTYQWTSNGTPVPGATSSTWTITSNAGDLVRCVVTTSNASGSTSATSDPVTVTPAGSGGITVPVSAQLPIITGSDTPGSAISCSTGTWLGNPTYYSFQWRADGVDIPGAIQPDHTIVEADGAAITCVVTAWNAAGPGTGTSAPLYVTSTSTTAPSNSVLPSIGGASGAGATLTCSPGAWSGSPTSFAYEWTADGNVIAGATGTTYVVSEAAGVQIRCTVTASNANGTASATSSPVTVSATPAPANTALPTVSGGTQVGQTLTCANGSWSNAPSSFAYRWTADGATIPGATSATHLIGEAVGAQVRCEVTATNAGGSSPATSAPITVTGAPPTVPTNSVAPSISGSTIAGSTLTCANGTWTGAPTYTYAWTASGAPIAGETSATYVIAQPVGTPIRCTVTATNAAGSANATSAPVAVTAPTPPANSTLPTISGASTSGSTLTCANGTWTNSPTSYAYAWTANGTPIAGQTSSTYVIAQAVGVQVRCVVTASNASGSASATSAAVTVTIAAPASTVAPALSGSTTTGSTLTCSNGTWSPAATSYAYSWTANGTPIAGQTAATYVIAQAVGTAIRCVVTATNAGGSSSATSSPVSVTAAPAPPSNTGQPSISGATTSGSTLTCATGTWTNSPTSYAYAWTANGTPIAGQTSATYVIAQPVGTLVRCVVTAANAAGSASATSAPTTVTVAAPSNTALPTVSGATTAGSTLSCTTGSWTPAATSWAYAWTANGTPIAGAASSTYVISNPVGTSLRCVVTATNAGGSASATSAATTVTAAPTPPANSTLPSISGSTTSGSTLTCANGTWTNAPSSYAYAWTANGTPIAGQASATYVIAQPVGTLIRCVVTAANGFGSTSATSAPTTVTVAAPSNTAPPTVSGATTVGSTLSCTTGSWTPAATSYTYAWTANGSPIAGATSSTYVIADAVGTSVRCVVTAANAGGSASATSAATTVTIAPPANTALPGVTGSTTAGSTLTCANGTWSNSPTSYTWAWTANGTPVSGATAATIVISQAVGTQLRCVVTATNAGGSTAATSTPVTVTLAPPASTIAPAITGSTNPGGTLTCSTGGWNPAPASYAFAWTANGTPIGGATAATHVVVEAVGTSIRCAVTGTNAAGSSTATSAAVTVSTAPPPSNATAPTTTGSSQVGSTLTCVRGTWTNAPTSYGYQWTADGAPIVGATTSTLVLSQTPGTLVRCEVTAANSGGAVTVASAAVTVTPIPPPTNAAAPSITGTPTVGGTLTCQVGTWNGTPTSYTFAWTANGVAIPGETASSHVVAEPVGSLVRCVVTAANGGGSAGATSAPTTIRVVAPINTAAPSIGGSLTSGSTLACAPGSWTGSPTFAYSWSADGATIPGATTATHLVVEAPGASVRCTVTASNGGGTISASSAPVTVASAGGGTTSTRTLTASIAPTVLTLAGKPAGAYVGGIVRCSPGTWSSAEAPSFTYSWSIAGATVPGAQSPQLTIPAGTANRQLACTVNASADGLAASGSSVAVTIAPYNVVYGSTSARVEDNLTGTAGNDRFVLGAGRDVARGMAGDDSLDGGAGDDTLYGWLGRDVLQGSLGNDVLWGGAGNDRIVGGAGTDRLQGEAGNDTIDARDLAATSDVVNCGAGRDIALVNRRDRVQGCETVRRSS